MSANNGQGIALPWLAGLLAPDLFVVALAADAERPHTVCSTLPAVGAATRTR